MNIINIQGYSLLLLFLFASNTNTSAAPATQNLENSSKATEVVCIFICNLVIINQLRIAGYQSGWFVIVNGIQNAQPSDIAFCI